MLQNNQLTEIMDPFMFEENNETTRETITNALYDYLNSNVDVREFAVQCNEINNTQDRIDAQELWIDIAAKCGAEKEFTYYPIRIKLAEKTSG
jgi:hypothetical protein